MKKLGQFLGYVGVVLLALAVLVSGLGVYTVRRSFPPVNGTLKVPGLQGKVEIFRDENGIPHIYAEDVHDLFMAQGYVHAQDRFYQMDFWRHQTAGRLSEMYGEASLGPDKFLRTVGWMRIAEQEYSLSDPESKSLLEAYAEGVNAYIGSRPAADLSLEYSILALNGLNYQPEPWNPASALAWAKAMAWDLRGNMDEEIRRAVLNAKIGEQKTWEYMPAPPQGYIATANNAVVGPDYPYLISLDWDAGYRARRIVDMINSQPRIDIAYIQRMQGDNLSLGAKEILPYVLELQLGDPKLAQAQEALRAWDYQLGLDSRPAAIYMSFLNALVAGTFHDDIPEDYWPDGGADTWLVLRGLLEKPESEWWDSQNTPGVETRDDILRQALAEGYAALEERLGGDPDEWTWGGLHTATFVNATVGRTGIAPIDALFNRGPFPAAGFSGIVNNTGGSLARDDRTDPKNRSDAFAVRSVPSLRLIADLSDLNNSLLIYTTGQSGHAYHPHYIDMADRWRFIQYHPMLWEHADVERSAEGHLTLVP